MIDEATVEVFDLIPTSVAIFDQATLRFLAVNKSAARELEYSAGALLEKTIVDICLPEDIRSFKNALAALSAEEKEAGHWRLRKGNGAFVEVSARWRPVVFQERQAVLATWCDVYSLQAGGDARAGVGQERAVLPERAEQTARLYRALFEAAPGKLLVVRPETYEIVAASDAYLDTTRTRREEITGKNFFEIFPYDPDKPHAAGVRNLRASLHQVEQSHKPDVMAVQCHPIPRTGSEGAGFEERFWSQVNAPVLDSDGRLVYIIHRVEDVTELTLSGADASFQSLDTSKRDLARDVLLRSQELGRINTLLQEQAARLRTAERLLDLGTWSYDLRTRSLAWSERVRELYGVPAESPMPDFDGYVELVHPEDRDGMVATFREFELSDAAQIMFQHRILRPDGAVVHLKGVGERHRIDGDDHVVGFVQDITEYVAASERLSRATGLMKMAGKRAKLGGWRVDVGSDRIGWTDEAAAIHEEPAGNQPTVDEALGYYDSESRTRIAGRFDRCLRRGADFDEVLQLVTAKGSHIWVRAMGEAVRDRRGAIVAVQGALQDITELVEAREKFKAITRQLHEMLENMGDAFFMVGHDWQFTFVNKQFELLSETLREKLIGRTLWEAFPGVEGSVFQTEYERVQRERTAARFAAFYPPLGKWFRVNAYPAPDGMAVYFTDITEERTREGHLRLLEAAVSRINDIVLITEAESIDAPDGPRVVFVNDAIERLTGYSREELLGVTPRILQGPETDRPELDRIRHALVQARPVRSEILNYTKDGLPYWLELEIVPLRDDDGILTHFVAVERDITERKRAEEAIRVRDERFRLLSRATHDVVWDWDLEADRIWWNDALSEIFSHDCQAFERGIASWINLIHPEDRSDTVDSFWKAVDGSSTNWVAEYRFARADGKHRMVVDRGFVIRDEAGKAVRMLGGMMDVTEQRELEARYLQAQKLEAVGQLTGGIAHDFNNLLTVILGNSEMLAEELSDPEQRGLAEMVMAAAGQGAKLTRGLLAFSRRQPLEPGHLDINRHVGGMEDLLRRTLREDIDLQFLLASDLWAADADSAQLESALLNLVINARDAMPNRGQLTIETANVSFGEDDTISQADEVRPGPYVMISVTDSGSGMSPDVVKRAFEPFFTTKEVGAGSGLGLSMIYGFIKQSGGYISISSEPGHGTMVKLYLPRSSEESGILQASPQPDCVRGGTESILVVEDDDMVRSYLVAQLRSLGYRVHSAEDGPRALEFLLRKDERIDLLVSDLVMPGGMNGGELAETAKAAIPALRVLFTSGYSKNLMTRQGRLKEGAHLLAKPYRRQELAEKVRMVLDENKTR